MVKFRYTAEEKAILWLDSFDFLTHKQKSDLLAFKKPMCLVTEFTSLREQVTKLIEKESYEKMLATLADGSYLLSLLSKLGKENVFFVTERSKDYPKELFMLPARPIVLYGKGNRELLQSKKFAIVGSRKEVGWAKELTRQISETLSEQFTIVTGLAEGGDECAVRGALKGERANLICVLPAGIDVVCPATHTELYHKVEKAGLLLSEHRLGVQPQRFLFPVRNRIIAGLANGVLITGGGEKSGTSITATYAMEYGKDVFAVPYSPGIREGVACNKLLKQGAALVENAKDILTWYHLTATEKPKIELTSDEEKLLSILQEIGEGHVEELSNKAGMPVWQISGVLVGLEVKGMIARLGGNRYATVK